MPSAAEIYLERLWLMFRGLLGWTGDVEDLNPGLGLTTSEVWRVAIYSEETLNDSDKKFTIPDNQEWEILWIWVTFTASATVGNRQLVLEIQEVDNEVIGQQRAGLVQAESTTYYYMLAPALSDMTSVRDTDFVSVPIPPTTFLKAGNQLRIYDNNAVDAAADDMAIQMQYAYRTIS